MDRELQRDHRSRYTIRQALAAIVVSLSAIGAITIFSDDGGGSVALAPTETSAATVDVTALEGNIAPAAPDTEMGVDSSRADESDSQTGSSAQDATGAAATAGTAATTNTITAATTASPVPAVAENAFGELPAIDATAFAVYDATSESWLAENQASIPLPVGSVMKLLTSYVVLQTGDLSKVVTVPELQVDISESAIGLYKGEQLPRDVLLRAMLIVSANDASRALAIDVGGSTEGFVEQMNAAAANLGLSNTVAANPIGLDATGAHSSARDMISLAALLLQDETFRAAVAKTSATLHGQTFAATNKLLTAYEGATGVKTGHTTDAGYCLVGSATRNGRTVIVAVLGAPTEDQRLAGATALLDWAFAQP